MKAPPKWFPRILPRVYDYPVLVLDTEGTGLEMFDDVPVGLSITACDEKNRPIRSWYLAWDHPTKNNTTLTEVRTWAKRELTNPEQPKWFHYARHDLHQLANVEIPIAGPIYCSMVLASMVRGYRYVPGESLGLKELAFRWCGIEPHEKARLDGWLMDHELKPGQDICKAPGRLVGRYAIEDTTSTAAIISYALGKAKQAELEATWDIERRLTIILWLMERRGVGFDFDLCEKWLHEVDKVYRRDVGRLGYKLGDAHFNPNSAQQLAKRWMLAGANEELLFTPPSDRFPDGQPSFTTDLLEHHYCNSRNPKLRKLANEALRLRKLRDLNTRYLRRYLEDDAVRHRDGWRIHATINQLPADTPGTGDHPGAVTGRCSMNDPSLHQVVHPEKQEKYGTAKWMIRKLFIPGKRHKWIRRDYSQLEFRLFAHFTGDPKLIRTYQEDPDADFHQIVADVVGLERKPGKTINFAMLYGMGKAKTAVRLQLSENEAAALIDRYHTLFPSARALKSHIDRTVRKRMAQHGVGWVKTLLGRRRYFRTGDSLNPCLNTAMQGSASDVIKLAQVLLYERYKIVSLIQVHDELNDDIPEHDVNRVMNLYDETMIEAGRILGCRVPLTTDGKAGDNWGDAT